MKGLRTALFALFIGGSLLVATVLTLINVEVNNQRMETLRQMSGNSAQDADQPEEGQVQVTSSPTVTFPPYTPLATVTDPPTATLRPPPTFEPATNTPPPSNTPSLTPSATLNVNLDNPGIVGYETNTPTPENPCEPRTDWTLRYTVQPNDALERIATLYNTSTQALAEGNCLADANMIVNGQVLRVPGDVQPDPNAVDCSVAWEVLTPINHAGSVDGDGSITFNWRGPAGQRNLLRIYNENGEQVYEDVVDLRQNITVSATELPTAFGHFSWRIFPLDLGYVQVCPEGPLWYFDKAEGSGGGTGGEGGGTEYDDLLTAIATFTP